jgi:hypothetical protein
MLNPTLIIAFQALLLRPSAAFAPSSPRCSPVVLLSCISQDDAEMPSRSNHLADDKRQTTRREALSAALVTLTTFTSSAQAAVIGAGRCANGEGDGCDSLAEGNAYIQSLQKKSLENKEENQRVSSRFEALFLLSNIKQRFSCIPSILLSGGTLLILHEKLPRCICCFRQTNGDEI